MLRYCILLMLLLIDTAYAGFGLGNQISRTISQNIAKNIADNFIKPELKIRNSAGSARFLTLDKEKKLLAFILADETIRVWDLALGSQRPTIQKSNSPYTQLVADAKRQLLFAGQKDGSVSMFDIITGKRLHTVRKNNGSAVTALAITAQGQLLAAYADATVLALAANTYQQQWQIISENSITKLLVNDNVVLMLANDKQKIALRQRNNGQLLWQHKPIDERIIHLANSGDQQAFLVAYATGDVLKITATTGQVESKLHIVDDMQVLALAGAHNFAAFSNTTKQTLIKNTETNQQLTLDYSGANIRFLAFTQAQDKLFVLNDNGGIFLFNAKTGKHQLQLISTLQGWTVLDNSGRFDSSEPGLANISWTVNSSEIALDKFSDNYYEPGLLATTLLNNHHYINKNPKAVQQGISLPPIVQLSFAQDSFTANERASLLVEVTGQHGGIGKISLFHNGKVLAFDEQTIKQQQENGISKKKMAVSFYPEVGNNTLEVIAANAMGIESVKARKNITLADPGHVPQVADLHIVAIGVNEYADPRLNLDYSVADAQSITRILEDKKILSIKKATPYELFNRQATKQAIIDTIKAAGNHAQSDVLAIYFAGHGIVVEGEWYFLPHEAILQPDASYYVNVGLSGQEIKNLLIATKAQKILVMIDSCYSGAGLDAFNYLLNAQRHMSRSLSRSVGIVVLTAARKDQTAAELTDLGHGLFTYTLTKGMTGDADAQPIDKKITAYEIVNFSQQHIPILSRKYAGSSQDPMVFKMGMDFDLLRK